MVSTETAPTASASAAADPLASGLTALRSRYTDFQGKRTARTEKHAAAQKAAQEAQVADHDHDAAAAQVEAGKAALHRLIDSSFVTAETSAKAA